MNIVLSSSRSKQSLHKLIIISLKAKQFPTVVRKVKALNPSTTYKWKLPKAIYFSSIKHRLRYNKLAFICTHKTDINHDILNLYNYF